MLLRALVNALLVLGLVTAGAPARAIDPGMVQIGLEIGGATGFLVGCRLILNSLKPARSVSFARGPKTVKRIFDSQIAELKTPEDSVALVTEEFGMNLVVRPRLKNGGEFPEKLQMGFFLFGRKHFVGFEDPSLNETVARNLMNNLTELLVQKGYSPDLKIEMKVVDSKDFKFHVSGAKDSTEWINANLNILKTWAVAYN